MNKSEKSPYKITDLPLEVVVPDPNQPRSDFDEEKIKGLAESIKKQGLLQPILIRPVESERFQIVHGERRYRACKLLGLETIRTEIRELSHKEVLEIQIVENLQREDLNSIEEAKAFRKMNNELGHTHEEIAQRIGKSREYVTNKLRLLNLPNDIQRGIARGNLSEGHARALLSLNDFEKQRQVCREISKKELNVRETEGFVQGLKDGDVSRETSEDAIIHIKDLAVFRLVDRKDRVSVDELESALICDLKTTRRLKHG